MTESILLTVKKMLGIAEEYHAFDLDIVININSVFLTLNQLGVGPESPFQITGDSEVWSSFVSTKDIPGIQTYIYLKTKLLFDPPTNSFLVDAIQKQIAEFEWRLNVQVDTEYLEEETDELESIIPTPITTPTIESNLLNTNTSTIQPQSTNHILEQTMRKSVPPTSESVKEAIARLKKSK